MIIDTQTRQTNQEILLQQTIAKSDGKPFLALLQAPATHPDLEQSVETANNLLGGEYITTSLLSPHAALMQQQLLSNEVLAAELYPMQWLATGHLSYQSEYGDVVISDRPATAKIDEKIVSIFQSQLENVAKKVLTQSDLASIAEFENSANLVRLSKSLEDERVLKATQRATELIPQWLRAKTTVHFTSDGLHVWIRNYDHSANSSISQWLSQMNQSTGLPIKSVVINGKNLSHQFIAFNSK